MFGQYEKEGRTVVSCRNEADVKCESVRRVGADERGASFLARSFMRRLIVYRLLSPDGIHAGLLC